MDAKSYFQLGLRTRVPLAQRVMRPALKEVHLQGVSMANLRYMRIFKYMTYSKHVPANIPQHPLERSRVHSCSTSQGNKIRLIHVDLNLPSLFPGKLTDFVCTRALNKTQQPPSAAAWKWKLLQKALKSRVLLQLRLPDLKGILWSYSFVYVINVIIDLLFVT